MTETTPNLILPYIMPSQAQKHVTHNEAIRARRTGADCRRSAGRRDAAD